MGSWGALTTGDGAVGADGVPRSEVGGGGSVGARSAGGGDGGDVASLGPTSLARASAACLPSAAVSWAFAPCSLPAPSPICTGVTSCASTSSSSAFTGPGAGFKPSRKALEICAAFHLAYLILWRVCVSVATYVLVDLAKHLEQLEKVACSDKCPRRSPV